MIKTIGLAKVVKQKPKVFASVVLDRLSGFAGIVIIAAIMFFVGYEHIPDRSVGGSIVAMTLVSLSITAVLFSNRIYSFCCALFNRWPVIKENLMSVHYDIALMKGKVGEGILTILLSGLSQVALAYVYFMVAKALNQDVGFFYFGMGIFSGESRSDAGRCGQHQPDQFSFYGHRRAYRRRDVCRYTS